MGLGPTFFNCGGASINVGGVGELQAGQQGHFASLPGEFQLGLVFPELLVWECGSQWLQGLAIIMGNAIVVGGHRFLSLAVQKSMQG